MNRHPQAQSHAAGTFSVAADGLRLRVRVSPRASADRIDGPAREADGGAALKIAVTAPPENGKANAAVVKLLAREWGLAKSSVTVVSGAADRRKLLHLSGEPGDLAERLERWLAERAADPAR